MPKRTLQDLSLHSSIVQEFPFQISKIAFDDKTWFDIKNEAGECGNLPEPLKRCKSVEIICQADFTALLENAFLDQVEIKEYEYSIKSQKLFFDSYGYWLKISTDEQGYTIIFPTKDNSSFKVSIHSTGIDGTVDGIGEDFTMNYSSEALIIKNSRNLRYSLINESDGSVNAIVISLTPQNLCEHAASSEFIDFTSSPLANYISPQFLGVDSIESASEEFLESSAITLQSFLKPEAVEKLKSELGDREWERIGPVDYQSYPVLKTGRHAPLILKLLILPSFREWLSAITQLPILQAFKPPFIRKLSSDGDYQILHGNYIEPIGLDLIYSIIPSLADGESWSEEICGRTHYLGDDGSEIFEVPAASNSLSLIFRLENCTRFTENVRGLENPPLMQALCTFEVPEETSE